MVSPFGIGKLICELSGAATTRPLEFGVAALFRASPVVR